MVAKKIKSQKRETKKQQAIPCVIRMNKKISNQFNIDNRIQTMDIGMTLFHSYFNLNDNCNNNDNMLKILKMIWLAKIFKYTVSIMVNLGSMAVISNMKF